MNTDYSSRHHEHHVILQYFKTSSNFGYSKDESARLDYMNLDEYLDMLVDEEKAKSLKEGIEAGKAQGLQEGKAQGLQEGKAQGLQEGKAQGLQNLTSYTFLL